MGCEQAVPILAPTGQVYYYGVRGMREGHVPSPWAPLVPWRELGVPAPAALLFTECRLEGRDGVGVGLFVGGTVGISESPEPWVGGGGYS